MPMSYWFVRVSAASCLLPDATFTCTVRSRIRYGWPLEWKSGRLRAASLFWAIFCVRNWASGNAARGEWRSEEHTSELQSHSDLVCRLLLEKKNEKRKD